ncbi:hypothetical protein LIER_30172 [Lithospermum erythrorhizon]|uniref:Uncharacterized protein n=1 Tax=Lithospermum erythrorhizon TaxID=34254 RepID=A0AAV3RLS7_LITER
MKLINHFLWGKIHWCSWPKLCAPYAEGGLNFRSFEDLYPAATFKVWFRLRENETALKFMLSRYCRLRHPSKAKVNDHYSKLWKRISAVREEAEAQITWNLGKGEIDFWIDPWLPSGPINPNAKFGTKVKEFWDNGHWNLDKLQNLYLS